MPDAVSIGLDFFKALFCFQCLNHRLAGFETIEACKVSGLRRHFAVVTDNLNRGQFVAHSDFKVIGVMGRCYLQPAGTEFHIHIGVFDEWNFSIH